MLGFLDFNFAWLGLITGQRLRDVLDRADEGAPASRTCPSGLLLSPRRSALATKSGCRAASIVDAMRASTRCPASSAPSLSMARWLFDGALVNPIPVLGMPGARRALRDRGQRQLRHCAAAAP